MGYCKHIFHSTCLINWLKKQRVNYLFKYRIVLIVEETLIEIQLVVIMRG